jgi:hypothetical protein
MSVIWGSTKEAENTIFDTGILKNCHSAASRLRGHATKTCDEIKGSLRGILPGAFQSFCRAVAEWSDADSIGAHYAYNNNLFCTLDVAAGEGRLGDLAILDAVNREWLSSNFGIRFGSIADLAKEVSR